LTRADRGQDTVHDEAEEGRTVRRQESKRAIVLAGLALLALAVALPAEAATVTRSGTVVSVDAAAGRVVIGDMGPRLKDGKSKITRRTIRLTPSTEFLLVKRATGVAPGGWNGGYVETRISAADVKPGAWVTVSGEPGPRGMTAAKVEVADPSGP
jgi:hypothetical protein